MFSLAAESFLSRFKKRELLGVYQSIFFPQF
jgi:hypothetical protein